MRPTLFLPPFVSVWPPVLLSVVLSPFLFAFLFVVVFVPLVCRHQYSRPGRAQFLTVDLSLTLWRVDIYKKFNTINFCLLKADFEVLPAKTGQMC